MNFRRIGALIERDLRKFFRSPALMMVSMVLPLVQLIVLGYAFGGKVTGVEIGFVDRTTPWNRTKSAKCLTASRRGRVRSK